MRVWDYLGVGTAVCCFYCSVFLCFVFLRRGDYHFERKFSGWVNYMRVGVMADSKMYHLVKILGYYLGLIK